MFQYILLYYDIHIYWLEVLLLSFLVILVFDLYFCSCVNKSIDFFVLGLYTIMFDIDYKIYILIIWVVIMGAGELVKTTASVSNCW